MFKSAADRTWWKAAIRDMLQHISPEELKDSLRRQYEPDPDVCANLMALVDEVSLKHHATVDQVPGYESTMQGPPGSVETPDSSNIERAKSRLKRPKQKASIRSFVKQSQEIPHYPDSGMQSNFSVPNSEKIEGSDVLTPDSASVPGSSYTDKLLSRKKILDRKKLEEQRDRRKQVANKLTTATKPGQYLTNAPKDKPGAEIKRMVEEVQERVKTLDRASRSSEREHEIAPEWSATEQTMGEEAVGAPAVPTPAVTPGVVKAPTSTPTTSPQKVQEDAQKVQDVAKKTDESVQKLNESIKKLLE